MRSLQRKLPSPPESTVEYRLAQWIAQHPPQGRVFATGGLRFRLNSWFDIPQVGGPFETGLRNRVPLDLAYRIRVAANLRPGHETEDTLSSLQALGAEYVVIHGRNSREYYRDFFKPERVAASLQQVYRIEDDAIYALPPRSQAHSLQVQWTDTSTLAVTGAVPPSQLVEVQVNADPGWHATQDGHEIAIAQDRLGFMVLHPSPAAQAHIELRYRGSAEQRIMAVLSAIAWIAALLALWAPARPG